MTVESPSGENDSTQPLSPPGVQRRDALQHVDGDDSSGDDHGHVSRSDARGTTYGPGAAQRTGKVAINKAPAIKASIEVATVTWTDHIGRSQRNRSYNGGGFTFKVALDTSRRTGLFKLQAEVQLKHDDLLASQTIFLFIYPENIHAVTGAEPLYTLKFSLKRPPDLVVPKGIPVESGQATDALLKSIFALAKVTSFDIQLPMAALLPKDLKLVLSILCHLSLGHNISTDKRRADLNPLYMGVGGEVVKFDRETESIAANPPIYQRDTAHSPNKLKRRCTSPDVAERRRATTSSHASSKAQNTTMHPDGGNSRLDDIYNLLVEMHGRFIKIESRVEQIEKTLASDGSEAPSQTMSEARLELLEELNDRIDHEIIDVQSRYADVTEELEEKITEFENTMSEALENFQRNAEDCEQEVEERLEERIERAVDKYLSNGMFQGSFSFNKQATAD